MNVWQKFRHKLNLCKKPRTFDDFEKRIDLEDRPGAIIECTAEDLHWSSCHRNETTYRCMICEVEFPNARAIDAHQDQSNHSGVSFARQRP